MGEINKYTVAVDFDGVIHAYTSGWQEGWMEDPLGLLDPPVEGAIEWLEKISRDFLVVILTTRGQYDGCDDAIWSWLIHHGYRGRRPRITNEKVAALVYVDDRGYRFEGPGTFPSRSQIHRLIPWNKRGR